MFTDYDIRQGWLALRLTLEKNFGKKPDMEAVLFLIGMQETGFIKLDISKEQKQDLMHVAVCTVLGLGGYYTLEGKDEDGWPHFKQVKELPSFDLTEQENFLKKHILLYFEHQDIK